MHTFSRFFFLSFWISLLSLNLNSQVNYYVSSNGNDKNIGTLKKPFRTLHHAVTKASDKANKNVNIYIQKGTYYITKPIIINSNEFLPQSLTIKAYNNHRVIMGGSKKLKLNWKYFKDGIYEAPIPEGILFESFFVNGVQQPLARYPNYDSTARVFHGTAADAIDSRRIKKWKNPVGGYVHALHSHEWGGFHYRITGLDEKGKLHLEGGWQNNRPSPMHEKYRFVENIFEELDTSGEWYLDRNNRTLYYYPPANVDILKATIEVSQIKNTITLVGTEKKPLRNVTISGLEFTQNERSFMDTKEPLLRSDWTIYRSGIILMEGAENCRIFDCSFYNSGGNAIMVSKYNQNNSISGCYIYNMGASAICFVGDTGAVRSATFNYNDYIPYNQLDKTPGPLTNNFPRKCIADNNLLHDLGTIEKQATGIQIEIASEITVSHNSIYNTPRAGINIGDGCFGGHIIEFNDVFNTVLETGDHGTFNSWGRDRFWAPQRKYMDSLIALHPELILLDAQKQTIIRNNRFRCDHGWDIDLDDGSSNYLIYNNLCLNGGIKLREGFYRTVENNIMVNNTFHPHVWFKNSHDIFERNIIMKKYAPIQIYDWGNRIDYNLFPDDFALNDARNRKTDENSIYGNPDFTNPASGDFSISPNSPALKIGFKNFRTDQFGVQKSTLKKIAKQSEIPTLIFLDNADNKSGTILFRGGTLKSVEGPGDRSAFGLPDETGVIIVSIEENSPLAQSGLLPKDVIISANGKSVKNGEQLITIYNEFQNKEFIDLEIIRNQQSLSIKLKTK